MVKRVDNTTDVVVNTDGRHFTVDGPLLVADIRVMIHYGDDPVLAYNHRPGKLLTQEEDSL